MTVAPSTISVLVSHWLLTGLGSILIALRILLRLKIQGQRLLISDVLLIGAWVCCIVSSSLGTDLAARGALNQENDFLLSNWDTETAEVEAASKIIWAGAMPFYTALYLCKFALLATYHQLFPTSMTLLRWALYGIIIYSIVGYVVTISIQLFLVWPIKENWTVGADRGTETKDAFIIAWVLHFSGAIVVGILPFTILRGLQMKTKVKIGVACIFLLGFIDMAFSLTRFVTVMLASEKSLPSFSVIQLWIALDENIALITACLPSLRPYLRLGFKSSTAEASNGYLANDTSKGTRTHGTLAQNGFSTLGPSVDRRGSIEGGDSEDDAWSHGRKSNRSDIELVSVKACPSDGLEVGPGDIRVQQSFQISQETRR